MIESADPGSPAHQVSARHKRQVTDYVESLLIAHGCPTPTALAGQFVVLMDGAIVTALRERSTAPAHQARAVAEMLLAQHVILHGVVSKPLNLKPAGASWQRCRTHYLRTL